MVAAMRNVEGIDVAIEETKATRSSSVVARRTSKIIRGTALFISVTTLFGFIFCLKEFLSRFLD
jgi:hypothetical protein